MKEYGVYVRTNYGWMYMMTCGKSEAMQYIEKAATYKYREWLLSDIVDIPDGFIKDEHMLLNHVIMVTVPATEGMMVDKLKNDWT